MDSKATIFHQTSLDAARQNITVAVHTGVHAGLKRSFPEASQPAQVWAGRKEQARLSTSPIISLIESQSQSEYSQRRVLSATPTSTVDPYLSLSHPDYELPVDLVQNFEIMGIQQIYPWQKNCLLAPGLLSGDRNLVYSAPTGGGKSLVADVVMLKRVLDSPGSKALLVLPYVALVQEKVRWLRNLVKGIVRERRRPVIASQHRQWSKRADEDTIRVVAFHGGSRIRASWHDFDIGVCTIEKANALVNTAIEDYTIADLKTLVLDELHMVNDGHRGYILELLATKILDASIFVQIVGMSATLSDLQALSSWLQAVSYVTHYRPVPISEFLVCDNKVFPAGKNLRGLKILPENCSPVRTVAISPHRELSDPVLNSVVALAHETVAADYGVLVFAGSRASCESLALLLSRTMPRLASLESTVTESRLDLVNNLRSLSTGLDSILAQTVPYGVIFHREFYVLWITHLRHKHFVSSVGYVI